MKLNATLFFQHKWLKHVHVLLLAIYTLSRLVDSFDHTRDRRWASDHYVHSGRSLCISSLAKLKYLWDNNLDVQREIVNCKCIWILWVLYLWSQMFTNWSALFINIHQEWRLDCLVSFSQEKDCPLKTMNLTLLGLCTYANIFISRNNWNHFSGQGQRHIHGVQFVWSFHGQRPNRWQISLNVCVSVVNEWDFILVTENFRDAMPFVWEKGSTTGAFLLLGA
jgi:hypothetical protein